MANSLFDQLQKTGLVDKKKAGKAKKSHYLNKKQKARGDHQADNEARRLAEQALREKQQRDRELNRQQQQAAEHKAIAAQIKQLIENSRIQDCDGDIVYHFTDDRQVRQLHINQRIHDHLSSARLAIVRYADSYALVPMSVAEKIRQRDASLVLSSSEPDQKTDIDEDDPYAAYEIPDDLMW